MTSAARVGPIPVGARALLLVAACALAGCGKAGAPVTNEQTIASDASAIAKAADRNVDAVIAQIDVESAALANEAGLAGAPDNSISPAPAETR